MHTSFDLFLVLNFLLTAKINLLGLKLFIFVSPLLAQSIGSPSCEPSSHVALDLQSNLLSLLVPHGRRSVLARVDNFVVPCVDVDARLLHLDAEFPHHAGRLSLVLVCLDLPLDLVGVKVLSLVGLGEGVVESDPGPVISETSEVGLRALRLLNSNRHYLHLVVSQADFDLELVGHHELVRLDRIVVILLLFSHLVAFLLAHHLLLHLLLLELLWKKRGGENERFRMLRLTYLELLLGVLAWLHHHLLPIHELLLLLTVHLDDVTVHVHHVAIHIHHHLLLVLHGRFVNHLLLATVNGLVSVDLVGVGGRCWLW